jgi:hypothetical protein
MSTAKSALPKPTQSVLRRCQSWLVFCCRQPYALFVFPEMLSVPNRFSLPNPCEHTFERVVWSQLIEQAAKSGLESTFMLGVPWGGISDDAAA